MSTERLERHQWGARPPKRQAPSIDSEGVTAHHYGPSPWGSSVDRSSAAAFLRTCDHNRCASMVRAAQNFHMDGRGWNDLAYSSMVCPHGTRYVGRGAGARTGANGTNTGNARSEAICYIAGSGDPLTPEAMHAFLDEAAALEGKQLRWDHSDWKPTECAGSAIRAWEAKGWPRPSTTPPGSKPEPVLPRPWRSFRSGDTDLSIHNRGGQRFEVSEAQLLLTYLADKWDDDKLDPHGIDGEHRGYSETAVTWFKRRIIAMQKATGQSVWPNDDPHVGPKTIAMLRLWRAWS